MVPYRRDRIRQAVEFYCKGEQIRRFARFVRGDIVKVAATVIAKYTVPLIAHNSLSFCNDAEISPEYNINLM